MKKPVVARGSTEGEVRRRKAFLDLMMKSPIPDDETLSNLGLFLNRQTLSRILFMDHIYRKILRVHGIIVEFGVRWGQNLAIFSSLRGMYEPFNYTRRIVGFDTFEGYPRVHEKDGEADHMKPGAYGVPAGYEEYLEEVLAYHESESPLSHIRRFELVKGDAVSGIDAYLRDRPETVVSLVYFDLDLYEPTKACLERIRGRLTRGSVIGFDEVCSRHFPGETRAVAEALGLERIGLRRVPWCPNSSYIVFGGSGT